MKMSIIIERTMAYQRISVEFHLIHSPFPTTHYSDYWNSSRVWILSPGRHWKLIRPPSVVIGKRSIDETKLPCTSRTRTWFSTPMLLSCMECDTSERECKYDPVRSCSRATWKESLRGCTEIVSPDHPIIAWFSKLCSITRCRREMLMKTAPVRWCVNGLKKS